MQEEKSSFPYLLDGCLCREGSKQGKHCGSGRVSVLGDPGLRIGRSSVYCDAGEWKETVLGAISPAQVNKPPAARC